MTTQIKVRYSSIDGCRETRSFKTLAGARAFAIKAVGAHPEIGSSYAVSGDGIGKITVTGVSLRQLFFDASQAPEADPEQEATFWLGRLGDFDDFEQPYGTVMYDAKTRMGPWANMSETSFKVFGIGKLGLGLGQKYQRQPDGRWLKVAG